ncbi:MAG: DUF1844 domain-containing protein [Sedimentisphaeraceae bacterium JB056]
MADEEKKIIVDDDWKQQAKAEKDKLSEEAKKEKEGKEEAADQQKRKFPAGNFASLVSMLTTQVLFALGVVVPKGMEEQKNPEPDFELAKYNIDILTDLQEKTKGNLNDEEADMIKQTVTQLQMAFVQIKNASGKTEE